MGKLIIGIIFTFLGILSFFDAIGTINPEQRLGGYAITLILFCIGIPLAIKGSRKPSGKGKKCPYCAEQIQPEAKVCRFCGKDVIPVVNMMSETKGGALAVMTGKSFAIVVGALFLIGLTFYIIGSMSKP